MLSFFFLFADGWVTKNLKLPTLPHFDVYVYRFNAAAKRHIATVAYGSMSTSDFLDVRGAESTVFRA